MTAQRNPEQMKILMQFFKTGKGEYGEGDQFLGLKTPQTREFVKRYYKDINLNDLDVLITNPYHEIRLCGLLILVEKFLKLMPKKNGADSVENITKRDEIINKYLDLSTYANNWDLVDLTAPKLVGNWYFIKSMIAEEEKERIIDTFAASENLWQRRISMVFTWTTTRLNHPELALKYALVHLADKHDLMQKAVGWMLREVGKICSEDILREFLNDHYNEISRTSLRYAIEKFDERERQYWLQKS